MKLTRITKPLRSVQVRVILAGDLNANLERYAQYYEHVYGDSMDTRGSFRRSFAPSSMLTVSSSRGHAPLTGTNRDATRLRPQPTAAPRHRHDLPARGTG